MGKYSTRIPNPIPIPPNAYLLAQAMDALEEPNRFLLVVLVDKPDEPVALGVAAWVRDDLGRLNRVRVTLAEKRLGVKEGTKES
jgi:hypothetical protein